MSEKSLYERQIHSFVLGGVLEQEGFFRDGKNKGKTDVRFYRCFKSFRSLLDQSKQAYESRHLMSANETRLSGRRHIRLFTHQRSGRKKRQRLGDESESTKETGNQVVNNGTSSNPMKTVSELFLGK